MRIRLGCAASMVALLAATTACAETEVRIDVDPAVETTGRGMPTAGRTSLSVTLGAKTMIVRSPDDTIVYDFERRRSVVLDPKTRTRVEYSLYAPVGFAVFELRNRNVIAQVLSKARSGKDVTVVPGNITTVTENEHALGIQESPSQPLRVTTEPSDTVYSSESRVLARVSNEGTPVAPEDARMFAQFVRHRIAVHPQVLAAVVESSRIPTRIVVTNLDPGPVSRTLTVTSIGPASEAPPDLRAFRARVPADDTDPIDAILDRGANLTAQQLAAARQKSEDDVAAAFRDGRVLDALLGSLERNSITGAGLPALTAEQKATIQSDPPTRRFLSIIGYTRKDDLPGAIAVLDELRPLTSKTFIIDLTKANDLAMLGKRVEAQAMFIDVLNANPCLGGAYKDLGDALFGGWDVPRAWRSWDVGRRIAPRFPSYTAVDQFERSLSTGHPEYF